MVNIKEFVPDFYHDIVEYEIIFDILNKQLQKYKDKVEEFNDNLYVETSKDYGLSEFEKILEILPDRNSETIEFRRKRVLNRYRLHFPFTEIWLREQLEFLLGKGNFFLELRHNEYELVIEFNVLSSSILKEFKETLSSVIPCNLTLKLSELINEEVFIEERHQIYLVDKYLKFDARLESLFAEFGGSVIDESLKLNTKMGSRFAKLIDIIGGGIDI